jgi:hypothetical protein
MSPLYHSSGAVGKWLRLVLTIGVAANREPRTANRELKRREDG